MMVSALAFTQNCLASSSLQQSAASAAPERPAIQLAANARQEKPRASACARLPGVWTLGMGDEVVIRSNGTAYHSFTGLSGNWRCNGRNVVVHWTSGATNEGLLSADGSHMSGTATGIPWSADRKGSPPSNEEAPRQLTPFDFCC
jgi:hypothetical protein